MKRALAFAIICLGLLGGVVLVTSTISPARAEKKPPYRKSFEAEGELRFRMSPHPTVSVTFVGPIRLKVSRGKASGSMVLGVQAGAYTAAGTGQGTLRLSGTYDPHTGTMSGRFEAEGTGFAVNPTAAGGAGGKAGGTWRARLLDHEGREIQGEITWDDYVKGYEKWPWTAASECKLILSRDEAVRVVREQVVTGSPSERRMLVLGRMEPLQKGDRVGPVYDGRISVKGPRREIMCPTWLFLVDDEPLAQYGHDVRLVYVDASVEPEDASAEVETHKWWPALNARKLWYTDVLRANAEEVVHPTGTAPTGPSGPVATPAEPEADSDLAVDFEWPRNGGSYAQGTRGMVVAVPRGGSGSYRECDFLADGVMQHTDRSAPFEHPMVLDRAGPHRLTVRVRDSAGAVALGSHAYTVTPASPTRASPGDALASTLGALAQIAQQPESEPIYAVLVHGGADEGFKANVTRVRGLLGKMGVPSRNILEYGPLAGHRPFTAIDQVAEGVRGFKMPANRPHTLLFYFCGHGFGDEVTVEYGPGEDENFIVLPSRLAGVLQSGLRSRGLSPASTVNYTNLCVVIESCFSDEYAAALVRMLKPHARDLAVLAASQKFAYNFNSSVRILGLGFGHDTGSVFTLSLCDALEAEFINVRKGRISLAAAVHRQFKDTVRRTKDRLARAYAIGYYVQLPRMWARLAGTVK